MKNEEFLVNLQALIRQKYKNIQDNEEIILFYHVWHYSPVFA